MAIADAARGWCDLLWLVDGRNQSVVAVRPLLERFGAVIDALGTSPAQTADALAPHSPDGLVTFFDSGMEELAVAAERLGLAFHTPQVARRLQDKLLQRDALRAAGLPTPQVVDLPAGADRASVERLASAIGFPAVLKPRRASGSWHTFPVAGPSALGALWDELAAGGPEARVLEEYLSDGPPMPQGFEADYVRSSDRGRRPLDAPRADRPLPACATVSRDRLLHPCHARQRPARGGARAGGTGAGGAWIRERLCSHRGEADGRGAADHRGQRNASAAVSRTCCDWPAAST